VPALRKYVQETRDRAVRLYEERRRDFPSETKGPPAMVDCRSARLRGGEFSRATVSNPPGWLSRTRPSNDQAQVGLDIAKNTR
jgi:hypothetical protein